MPRSILISRQDGGLTILPVPDGVDPFQHVENWRQSAPAEFAPVSVRTVEDGAWPADRSFRAAWVDTGDDVAVDMPKARVLHLARLRQERNDLLTALDAEMLRVIADAKALAEVEARKQVLRDLPALPDWLAAGRDIEAAETPENLLAVRPASLDTARAAAGKGGR